MVCEKGTKVTWFPMVELEMVVPELGATSHAINDTDSTSLCWQFGQITHYLLMLCISTKYF
jgi:hypothetical protein